MNPGITKLVKLLNAHGFATVDSGDAKTREFQCDRPYPYVVIVVDVGCLLQETRFLRRVLDGYGIRVAPICPDPVPQIQASFDPCSESAVIELFHVDDTYLK